MNPVLEDLLPDEYMKQTTSEQAAVVSGVKDERRVNSEVMLLSGVYFDINARILGHLGCIGRRERSLNCADYMNLVADTLIKYEPKVNELGGLKYVNLINRGPNAEYYKALKRSFIRRKYKEGALVGGGFDPFTFVFANGPLSDSPHPDLSPPTERPDSPKASFRKKKQTKKKKPSFKHKYPRVEGRKFYLNKKSRGKKITKEIIEKYPKLFKHWARIFPTRQPRVQAIDTE